MSYSITQNIQRFQEELPAEVDLVAVSKTKPLEDLREAYDAGQRDFGENKVQEMVHKYEELPSDIRWHMIGHVQSNKIKYMAPFVHLVHGIDKAKRLKELNKEAAKNERKIDCLLQVHIAEEESKFGFDFPEVEELFTQGVEEKYPHLRVRGLMGMATLTDDTAQIRSEFRGLAELFRGLAQKVAPSYFDILSTGMSGDYKIALEEGSTMLRLGSTIFGPRD